MKRKKISYQKSGVDYSQLDPIKVLAQKTAQKTSKQLNSFGFSEVSASRGESAYVWEEKDGYRAFVVEGLGTKNLVADAMQKITGKSYYAAIAQDTVAMIVNDLIVVGAQPQVVNAYFAVGSSDWFKDEKRSRDLVIGWGKACELAGATWGGGETPTLKGIIDPSTIDLGGAAVGIIKPKKRLVLGDKLTSADAILLIESSGVHANGLTLCRTLAEKLKKGYATPLASGELFGEALLKPTHIYAQVIADLFENGVDIHYLVNITGHGWRKLMRATHAFSYIIEQNPPVPDLFTFIQKHSGLSAEEMYATFNMGAGFAVFLPEKQVQKAQKIIAKHKFKSWKIGYIEKGPKKIVIRPLNFVYEEYQLQVR